MPHRWCDSALIRREQIESGKDLTFNKVFKPLIVSRVAVLSPKMVLEVGAGTGYISKELVSIGAAVTAIEPSKGMYEVTKEVLSESSVKLLNCTSFDLKKTETFEVAISHLVAHVVEDLQGFLCSIGRHLPQGGHSIFSIPHPSFTMTIRNFLAMSITTWCLLLRMCRLIFPKTAKTLLGVFHTIIGHYHRILIRLLNQALQLTGLMKLILKM